MAEDEDQKYEVLQKIGQGSFGIIHKVRHRSTAQILCRKEISYSRMSDKEKHQLASELDILRTLRHPNIVTYFSRHHIKSTADIHLYMEYCGNGDLGGYIKGLRDRGEYAPEDFVWGVFAQLVSALYRCHYGEDAPRVGEEGLVKKGRALQSKEGHRVILHRDLKPENVFLGANNAVKLGDFGLSKIIASHDFASTYVGTPFYMSPEICAAERYSHHSDVWSLGCIIYELATRNVPFDARSHVELVMKIKAGRIKALPDVYSRELWECISWCLKVDPRQRPDMAQLLNVAKIREARGRIEQGLVLEKAQQERDAALSKLNSALKQVQELQTEVQRLREAGKKIEMEWHTKATLAIDQRVAETTAKQNAELERQKAHLQAQFEAAVEHQVDEKLRLHQASLSHSHVPGQNGDVAVYVRSSTPPPGKSQASFTTTTTTTTGAGSDGSSVVRESDGSSLETEISGLSIMEQEEPDDASPLAQRSKPPPKSRRQPFGRAKTLANCSFEGQATASPMDVHMADPSPMPNHVATMSLKSLSLSPRRDGVRASMKKNIFAVASEQRLRPAVTGDVESSFTDDDILEEENELDADNLGDSPSRPSSGLSSHGLGHHHNGDPFQAFGAGSNNEPTKQPPPQRHLAHRPSLLVRQQTMPVNTQPGIRTRQRSNLFGAAARTDKPVLANGLEKQKEKENRPPSRARSNVPVLASGSPTRPATTKDGRILTPSRKAPAPPTAASNVLPRPGTAGHLTKAANANMILSPGKAGLKGRTLVELNQARAMAAAAADEPADLDVGIRGAVPKLLQSPAKWDPEEMGDDMPSPFLAKKGWEARGMRQMR